MSELAYLTKGVFRSDVLADVDGQPRLVGSRCKNCGDVRFPHAPACPACQAPADKLEAAILSRIGTVVTASRVERAIEPHKAPYLLSYVQLPEGPRVFCQLLAPSLEPRDVIGSRCELVVDKLFEKEGVAVNGYKFKVQP